MTTLSDRYSALKAQLLRAAHSVAGLSQARLELASVELAQVLEQLQLRLALLFAGVLFAVFSVLGFGALVAVLLWDTHPVLAILLPTLVYLVAGVGLIWSSINIGRSSDIPFAASLAEFEKDRATLLGEAGTPEPNKAA